MRLFSSVFALSALVVVLVQPSASSAVDIEPPTRFSSEAPGAPFVPDRDRGAAVIRRAELVRHIERLDLAISLAADESTLASSALQTERALLQSELNELGLDELAATTEPFGIDIGIFPVDVLRKPMINDWGQPRSGGRRHKGTDVLAHWGIPLRAIEDSVVDRVGISSLGGRAVHLTGKSGAHYYYAHLDEYAVEEGDELLAGELVGTNGDSGNARGAPHLHIQIDPSGGNNWSNPYFLLAALWGGGDGSSTGPAGPPNTSD